MIHHILSGMGIALTSVALPMTWKKFDRFVKQHCPDLSRNYALLLKINLVVLVISMLLSLIFAPEDRKNAIDGLIPLDTWGVLIIWCANVLTYWMIFLKGAENCRDARVFKSPVFPNGRPPLWLLKIFFWLIWLLFMFLGLLMLVAGNAQWIAAWLQDGR